MSWKVGQTWWLGDDCLLCVHIDEHGSHQSEVIARITDGSSYCPGCGAQVRWETRPGIHDLPWCEECQDLEALRERWESARSRVDLLRESYYRSWPEEKRSELNAAIEACEQAEQLYLEVRDAIAAHED